MFERLLFDNRKYLVKRKFINTILVIRIKTRKSEFRYRPMSRVEKPENRIAMNCVYFPEWVAVAIPCNVFQLFNSFGVFQVILGILFLNYSFIIYYINSRW